MAATTPLTIARPTGTARGGVVVLQEAFGVNAHITDVCQRLADAGWLAVAPHLFHRTGDPELGYEDLAAIWPHVEAMTIESVSEDIDAALGALAAEGIGPGRTGVVGFCLGGTVAFWTARQRTVGAAVTFYGGGITGRWCFPSQVETAPELQSPWLGIYGDLDQGIPVDEVEQLRTATGGAAVDTEVVRFPDAGHGFNCDQRASYHAESASAAWTRTLAWFETHLPPG